MSKDTARQEVEKVCFAYEKAGKTGNKKDWGKFYDLEEPLIKKVEFANQPKLRIPKKIAELLDTSNGDWGNVEIEELDYWIFPNIPDGKESYRSALASAYLAGKALGVELVEVK